MDVPRTNMMRCLSVRDPWASRIIAGLKCVENRSWGLHVRGRIGIHRCGLGGAIIGTVEVIDVLPLAEALERYPEYAADISGPLCWILASPFVLDVEIPCRGRLNLWTAPK